MKLTFDFFAPFWVAAVVLLITGTIPFTPVAVGVLLLLSQVHLNYTWGV